MSELIRQPELLKGELARRSEAGSPTQDGLLLELRRARARLDAVPREMDRLVDGYGKNLIPDDRMRPRMEALKDEQGGSSIGWQSWKARWPACKGKRL
jgi:hypothetical protein